MSRTKRIRTVSQRPGTLSWMWVAILCWMCGPLNGVCEETIKVDWASLRSVDQQPVTSAAAKWRIVCFLGAECPLARLYGPRLEALSQEFAEWGVEFVGVNSNPQDSPNDIRKYVKTHRISFPIVKDAQQSLVKRFGATRTPEVFVLESNGTVRYRGRIDDQYEPGISRTTPTRRDLRLAVEALLAGRDVARPETEAVGCLITIKREPQNATDPKNAITFSRDIAPLLNRHCVECHREGEIGPFSLTEYDEVVGWGDMILEVITQKRMPPWHAEAGYGKFVGERRLPKEALQTLTTWVDAGMPAGNLDDLPPQSQWPEGWHLPTRPDAEFVMREQPFVVPAEGTVEYQYFVVDPQWDEERWVRAVQVIPGKASVVHHTIIFVRPPDDQRAEGIGWLGGYVPGQRVTPLPPGHGRRIPAGSKFVFQMHYTPNGEVTEDQTRVGIWLSDPDSVTHEVTSAVALNHEFEIPPNASGYTVRFDLDGFARESKLLGIIPHMHVRGKSFRLEVKQNSERETLLSVPKYDFNWQHRYLLQEPLPLRQVDALEMQATFDNSDRNPTNPDPQAYVTWGDQTWQEMAVAFFDISHPRDQPRIAARREQKPAQGQQAQRIEKEVQRFLDELDQNGDGVIVPDETPETFRRFGFSRIDRNYDRRIDREEIEHAARRRF